MNKPLRAAITGCFALATLWVSSCVKPMAPGDQPYLNGATVTLQSAGDGAYRIMVGRESSGWDPALTGKPVLFNIYRRSVYTRARSLLARTFGAEAPGLVPGKTYYYRDPLGKIERIPYDNTDAYVDVLNRRTTEAFEYGVSTLTGLVPENDSTFTLGLTGPVSYYPMQVGGGFRVELLIDGGDALYTTDRVVSLSGQFDTTGVETLVVARFTDLPDTSLPGRCDTIPKDRWAAFFNETLEIFDGGRAHFVRTDTLPSGPGDKRIVLTPLGDSLRITFAPLSKTIKITPYTASVGLDLLAPGFRTRIRDAQKMVCAISDTLPVVFSTFGDSSFADTTPVYIWIATRSRASTFFKTVSGVAVPTLDRMVDTAWYPIGKGTKYTYVGCLYESLPETLTLNPYGQASARFVVSEDMPFRVSPLAKVTKGAIWGTFPPVVTTTIFVPAAEISAPFPARPGSLFGFDIADLNTFRPETLSGTQFALETWHDQRAYATRDTIYEGLYSYDGAWYVPPFQHLPVNVTSAYNGVKEFVVVALTYGKYFGEPRMFFSKFTTPYTYVWDKMPPHITWSLQYDPQSSPTYAPMYYRDLNNSAADRVTNLSVLDYLFEVHLLTDGITGMEAGVRDAGFGRIKSVSLAFHYAGTPYSVDPITNTRYYQDGTEVILKDLDNDQISRQINKKYDYNRQSSIAIPNAVFRNIDASSWRNGLWDLWVITEDDLGNKGMAPYGGDKAKVGTIDGRFMTRQIEVK